jgi:hypothetical protein
MKKLFFLFAFLGAVLFSNAIQAQEYNSAIGLRAGYPYAVTYKKFLGGSNAFEGIVGFGLGSGSPLYIQGLYQIHKPFPDVDGLMWYYGGGAGILLSSSNLGINVSGNIGLDYKFADIPLNLSLDWIPGFYFGKYRAFNNNFGAGVGGLAIRYTLN